MQTPETVADEDTFELFKSKNLVWKSCLDGADQNSIFRQIHRMMWNAAVFNVINEARKMAPDARGGHKVINGMVHSFVDRCFFDSQFLTIRRLVDGSKDIDDPKKGIFSLRALLLDMKKNAPLLTRRNLFLMDNMEYDYEAMQRKESAYFSTSSVNSADGTVEEWPFACDSHSIRVRHEHIDTLTGADPSGRSPGDFVRDEVFDFLIAKVAKTSANISLYATKFIAHSASPESREYDSANSIKITLGHLQDAHSAICQTANFIDAMMISRASHNFLPMPQFDQFKYIDRALVAKEDVANLSRSWQEYRDIIERSGSWGMKEFRQELAHYGHKHLDDTGFPVTVHKQDLPQ